MDFSKSTEIGAVRADCRSSGNLAGTHHLCQESGALIAPDGQSSHNLAESKGWRQEIRGLAVSDCQSSHNLAENPPDAKKAELWSRRAVRARITWRLRVEARASFVVSLSA